MVKAGRGTLELVEGMDFAGFLDDAKTRFAVAMTVGIIGEAAKNVPQETRGINPQVPWADMAGMRDVLYHRYFTINWADAWRTVQEDIPGLLAQLRRLDAGLSRLSSDVIITPAMLIKDLGEFGVIDLLNRMVVEGRVEAVDGNPGEAELLVDTGDDTAAWRVNGATELFTTDTVVEGVHFTRRTTPWHDLGWKSLASNVSDIASMGGRPAFALVTLGLPPETAVADLQDLYRGMLEMGNRCGVSIVGGDMVRSPVAFITVALTGVTRHPPMLRSSARPGDLIAVTGCLGSSAGGLKLMLEDLAASPEAAEYLKDAHRRPVPDVAAGQALAAAGVQTAMDISDGLVDDLGKLCRASGVSAQVRADRMPIHPLLRETFPDNCLDLALNGGEDYKLLFAAAPSLMAQVQQDLPETVAIVGQITAGNPGQVTVVDSSGAEMAANRRGWDHFSA